MKGRRNRLKRGLHNLKSLIIIYALVVIEILKNRRIIYHGKLLAMLVFSTFILIPNNCTLNIESSPTRQVKKLKNLHVKKF